MGAPVSDFHSFALDIESLRQDLLTMGQQAPLIMARALNRAAISGQAATVKAVVADTGLAAKYVKRAIVLDKANWTRPVVALTIKGSRIPLIAFGARGRRPSRGRGASVSAGVRGSQRSYPGSFIARVPNAGSESNWHEGVFVRDTRRGGSSRKSVGAWSKNLPIRQLYGPSIPYVFEKKLDVFGTAAQESLLKNLASEINFARIKNQPAEEFPLPHGA